MFTQAKKNICILYFSLDKITSQTMTSSGQNVKAQLLLCFSLSPQKSYGIAVAQLFFQQH